MIEPAEDSSESRGSEAPAARAQAGSTGRLLLIALVTILISGLLAAVVATLVVRWQSRTNPQSVDLGSNVTVTEDSAIEHVVGAAEPAVVSITAAGSSGSSLGSGFVVTKDGYIVTSTRVVADASGLSVVIPGDVHAHDARLVDSDCVTGIAVVKVDSVADLPTLAFGDSAGLKLGQTLVALGGPLESQGRVVHAVVSDSHRSLTVPDPVDSARQLQRSDVIVLDSPLATGDSGGPLLNIGGEVVGVAVRTEQASSVNSFAISGNQVRPEIEQIIQGGQVSVPSMDAQWTDLSPGDAASRGLAGGAVVSGVTGGGAAQLAGLQAGDVITQVDDAKVDGAHPLSELFRTRFHGGERVTLTLQRGGGAIQVQLTLTASHPSCS